MRNIAMMLTVGVMALTITGAQASPCTDGRADGQNAAEQLWTATYNSDCFSVQSFKDQAIADLIDGTYADSPTANFADRSFNRCARGAVGKYIKEKQKECLNTGNCATLGETVADEIALEYCNQLTKFLASLTQYEEQCLDLATDTCEGIMAVTIRDSIQAGTCEDDDGNPRTIEDLTFDVLDEQKSYCEPRVREYLNLDLD